MAWSPVIDGFGFSQQRITSSSMSVKPASSNKRFV
jgi:hypothetical protein